MGSERFAKSKDTIVSDEDIVMWAWHTVWQVLALIQRIVTEGKCLTQRDAYYMLIQHFRHQAEFNDTLQGLCHLYIRHVA